MSLQQKYLKILSAIAPFGAAGVSLLLGSATPASANPEPPGSQPQATKDAGVAERLAAIREAVSATAHQPATKIEDVGRLRLAWGNWWRNGGWWRPWGWPNWNNWHNWRNWPNWWRNW